MRRIINKPEKVQPSLAEYGRTENLAEDCQHTAPKFSGPDNITKIFMLPSCKFESFFFFNYEPWSAIYLPKCLRHKLSLRIFSLKWYSHITLLYQFFFPKIFPFTPNFVSIGIKVHFDCTRQRNISLGAKALHCKTLAQMLVVLHLKGER